MTTSNSILKAAVDAFAAAGDGARDHPSPDELLSFHAGDLGRDDRERVTRHLAQCAECTEAVLDVARFPDVEARESSRRLSQRDVEERRRKLRTRLAVAADRDADAGRVVAIHAKRSEWLRSAWFARAAAAALLAVALGLSAMVAAWRQQAMKAAMPRVNVPIVELAARAEPGERGEAGDRTIRVPADAEGVLLVLALVDPRMHPGYSAVIRQAGGEERAVWSSEAIRRSPEGVFSIEIPREFLAAGRYEIEIRAAGSSEPLAAYGFEIEYP